MEWTCTACGSSVVATEGSLPASMGWRVLSPTQAVCAPCQRKAAEYKRPRARSAGGERALTSSVAGMQRGARPR